MNRMTEDGLAKKAFEYEVQGRRPKRRWEEEISDILREGGKYFRVEERKSKERGYWKRLVQEWT